MTRFDTGYGGAARAEAARRRPTGGGGHTPLVKALLAVDDATPAHVAAVDACVAAVSRAPDSIEYSAKVGLATLEPYRFTWYWDVGRHPRGLAREIVSTFRACADRTGAVVPEALLDAPFDAGPVLQLVVGLDARPDPAATRVKLYAVLSLGARSVVEALGELCGVPQPPPSVDLDLTYIVGLDFGPRGLVDMKLYFALDGRSAPRLLRAPSSAGELLSLSRLIVFQQGLVDPAKRALFFHANDRALLRRELARSLGPDRPMSHLLTRARAMGDVVGTALDPWILSYPLVGGSLERETCNVYFHCRST